MSVGWTLAQHAIHAPYAVGRIVVAYVVPWFTPRVSVSLEERESQDAGRVREVELIGRPLGSRNIEKAVGEVGEVGDAGEASESSETSTGLIPGPPVQKPSTYLWPHLVVNMPSAAEIGTRALTTLVVELPAFTAKSLYASPVPTLIVLYAILPSPVWKVLFPRLLRYAALM